jgi:predicted P-loop ATPase
LQWDGTDRIEPLVESITSDTGNPIFRYTAVRSWLLGIIESIFQQTPNILQLIFAGKQNTGKSVFFKQLLPEQLKRYLALSQLDSGKDDEILMCEKLIILDDEYSGKSKDDARKIKRLLSAPYFNLREPYGRQNVTMRRLASLCATTNETEILNDVTGNRRNLVLEVTGKFDFKKYNEIDKEQLFVQLYRLHIDGFTSELNQAMIDQIQEFTHGRNSEPNREFEALDHFFYEPGIWDGVSYLTNTEILAIVYSGWKMNLSQRKLGMVMKELGYPRIKQKGIYKYKIQPKMLQIG